MIPVAARTKEWVCGCLLADPEGPNSAGGVDVYFMKVLCDVR